MKTKLYTSKARSGSLMSKYNTVLLFVYMILMASVVLSFSPFIPTVHGQPTTEEFPRVKSLRFWKNGTDTIVTFTLFFPYRTDKGVSVEQMEIDIDGDIQLLTLVYWEVDDSFPSDAADYLILLNASDSYNLQGYPMGWFDWFEKNYIANGNEITVDYNMGQVTGAPTVSARARFFAEATWGYGHYPDVEQFWGVWSDPQQLEDLPSDSSPCLIATATYGSELTPQVQFLRDFRDYRVLYTFAGDSFMTVFNAFYYSFSPDVADSIRGSNGLRDVMKVVLYPLVGVLQVSENIFSFLSFNPELAVVTTGFIASALLAVIYLLPLTLLIRYFRKMPFLKPLSHAVGVIWLVSLASIILAEISTSQALMMTATGTFVLASMGITTVSLMMVLPSIFHKISKFTITRMRVSQQ